MKLRNYLYIYILKIWSTLTKISNERFKLKFFEILEGYIANF
jgi:hypothetical protein